MTLSAWLYSEPYRKSKIDLFANQLTTESRFWAKSSILYYAPSYISSYVIDNTNQYNYNLKSISPKNGALTFQKNILYTLINPFKNDEKYLLFHYKSSFCSQDLNFFLTFWLGRKNRLIRTIWLISKFMTSKPGYQAITIHILPNISQSK